ncbi:phosphatase PAP2 family protein [Pinisolibacter aquiterrae]|uniref:phosphatase PAP2 family protein n=1 Tax=Pinisolibacter aquiterrae TaxID=2815579 RepID=UPI001C3CDCE5|nr:phosphatase PAP2 family protein [Pinisolibacter aquiterrae]MCC8235716.1 phosphatase PAP2 family protein [Pinisolibacter aquiterrae]
MTLSTSLIETSLRRVGAALRRLGHGARLTARRRPVHERRLGPALERPSFVLACGLVVALAAIPLFDPLMRFRPVVADGSIADRILTFGTSFGEGVELLVGSGVLLLLLAAIDPAELTRAVRVRLHGVATAFGFVFASVAGSGLFASSIKNLYGRARPEHLVGDGVFQLHGAAFSAQWAAFPSGHATTAGASAAVLALLFPRWRGVAWAAGAAIAVTRIGLGAHFPSDVAAGFALGAAVTFFLAHRLAARGLVFAQGADGRLVVRRAAGPAGWFDLLADLLAARRGHTA